MDKIKKIIVSTDGGSRSNPGQAAAAFVIQNEKGDVLVKDGKYLGIATNNQAEYWGVKLALERLQSDFGNNPLSDIEIKIDSQLVVQQLLGNFKVKDPKMKILFEEVKKLEGNIGKIHYTYIPRSQNYLADALVNSILDNQ